MTVKDYYEDFHPKYQKAIRFLQKLEDLVQGNEDPAKNPMKNSAKNSAWDSTQNPVQNPTAADSGYVGKSQRKHHLEQLCRDPEVYQFLYEAVCAYQMQVLNEQVEPGLAKQDNP